MKLCKRELDAEKWKLIEGSKGYYVSDMGRIKHIWPKSKKEKLLTPFVHKTDPKHRGNKNYLIKIYFKSWDYKVLVVSQLVYKHFVGPIPEGYLVYHKNQVQSDNRVINLALATPKQLGVKYGGHRMVGIYKIHPTENKIIEFFKTTREVEEKCFIGRQSVSEYCNGVRSGVKNTGFRWKWANEVNEDLYD